MGGGEGSVCGGGGGSLAGLSQSTDNINSNTDNIVTSLYIIIGQDTSLDVQLVNANIKPLL